MRLALLLLALPLFAADAPKPTVEDLTKQLAAKDAQIAWLQQKLAATEQQVQGLAQYSNGGDRVRQLEAQKPPDPPKPVDKPKP